LDSRATCWTVIRGAAAGEQRERDEFARRYLPIVRQYLGARWRASPLRDDIDDIVQEVFVTFFKADGPLARADEDRPFRPFFYGVVRNVAREHERRGQRNKEKATLPSEMPGDDDGLSTAFDRAWAMSLLKQAVERHKEIAKDPRDIELLRLRFEENLPVREIAKRWDADAARVHKAYARARDGYKAALTEVVAFHHPGTAGEVERECARLLALFK
jgi:RNA polymerase sigma-70 factor (ECF subfamily)